MKNPVIVSVVCAIAVAAGQADAEAPRLRPDQQRLVERVLKDMEPSTRPLMREQFSKNFASLDEKQVAAVLAGMEEDADARPSANASEEAEISPEALAYNRAQYEPVIRKLHSARQSYDEFVNTTIAQACPGRDKYARFGSGWRYELPMLRETQRTAAPTADTDVVVLGSTYAPQDGKYDFDFTKVRYQYDKAAVGAAIKQACTAYEETGKAFLAKLDEALATKDWKAAYALEQAQQPKVEAIRTRLNPVIEAGAPDSAHELLNALQEGRRRK